MRRAAWLAALALLALVAAATAVSAAASAPLSRLSTQAQVVQPLSVPGPELGFTVTRPNPRAALLVDESTVLTVKLDAPASVDGLRLSASCTIAGASTLVALTPKSVLSGSVVVFAAGEVEKTLSFRAHVSEAEVATCVFEYLEGDARFHGEESNAAASLCIPVKVPTLSAVGIDVQTGGVLFGSTTPVQVATQVPATVDTAFHVSCTDDKSGSPAQEFTVTVAAGTSLSTPFLYQAPSLLASVTCKVTDADSEQGDARFTHSTFDACFSVLAPRVSRTTFPARILTGSSTTFSLNTNGPVQGLLSFELTCALDGVVQTELTQVVSFAEGESTKEVTLTMGYTAGAAWSCAFGVHADLSTDARFHGAVDDHTQLPPLAFEVVKPQIIAPTTPTSIYSYESASFLVGLSDPVQGAGKGLTLQAECSLTSTPGVAVGVLSDAEFTEGAVTAGLCFTALTRAVGQVTCTLSFKASADVASDFVEYKESTASFSFEIVRPALHVTANPTTLLTGEEATMDLEASVPALGVLRVTVNCEGGEVKEVVYPGGMIPLSASSPHFVMNEGETWARLVFVAPLQSGTVKCKFGYHSGDVRYRSTPVAKVIFTVTAPVLTLNQLTDGMHVDAGRVFEGLQVSSSVPIAAEAALKLKLLCTFTGGDTRKVNFFFASGASESILNDPAESKLVVPYGFVGNATCILLIDSTLTGFDTRFTNAVTVPSSPFILQIAAPLLAVSGIDEGSVQAVGASVTLYLVAGVPVVAGATVEVGVSCAVTGATPATIGTTLRIDASNGQAFMGYAPLVLANALTADADASVACTFGAASVTGTGAEAFVGFVIPPLSFALTAPSITFSSNVPSTVVASVRTGVYTVRANANVVAKGAVQLPLTCTVAASGATFVTTLTLQNGLSLATAQLSTEHLGAHSCTMLPSDIIATGDATFNHAKIAEGLPITFTAVAPSFSILGAEGELVVNAANDVALKINDGALPLAPLSVVVSCGGGGADLTFAFAAGESSSTRPYTPTLLGSGYKCQVVSVTGPDCFVPSGLDASSAAKTFAVVKATVTLQGLSDGDELVIGSSRPLTLLASAKLRTASTFRLECRDNTVSPSVVYTTLDLVFSANGKTSAATALVAGMEAKSEITCQGAFLAGGDARFTNAVLKPLAAVRFSVALPVVAASHSGALLVNSASSLVLTASVAPASGDDVLYDVACTRGVIGGTARITLVGGSLTSLPLAYTAPAIAGQVTCHFSFLIGDARFQHVVVESLSFTIAEPPVSSSSSSSSSTGAASSSSSSSSSSTGAASSSSSSSSSSTGSQGQVGGGSSSSSSGVDGGNSFVVEKESSSGLTDGAKAAVAIGVIFGVALVAAAIFALLNAFVFTGSAAAAAGAGASAAAVPVGAAAV